MRVGRESWEWEGRMRVRGRIERVGREGME